MTEQPRQADGQMPVIVVGGGPSGLAAAFRLRQAGQQVMLLDKNDYVGGKMRTVRRDGYVFDTGATAVCGASVEVMRLCRDAGVLDQLRPGGSKLGFVRDGQLHYLDSAHLIRDALRTKLLSTRAKATMVKFVLDNLRIARHLNNEDLSTAARFDTESCLEYCDRRLDRELYDYIVDCSMRGLVGVRGDRASKLEFFFQWNKVVGKEFLHFPDGMETLPLALAKDLDVRLGAEVRQVEERGDEVLVTWCDAAGVEHVERAAAAVLAVSANVTGALVPQLPADCGSFLREVEYSAMISTHVGLARPPKDESAFMVQIPRTEHPGLFGIAFDHNKAPTSVPTGRGLITLYTDSEWSKALIGEDDTTIAERCMAAAEQVMPGVTAGAEFTDVTCWSSTALYSRPGYYQDLARFRAALPESRIKLAGDYHASSNINTAIAAGERAVRELLAGRTASRLAV